MLLLLLGLLLRRALLSRLAEASGYGSRRERGSRAGRENGERAGSRMSSDSRGRRR